MGIKPIPTKSPSNLPQGGEVHNTVCFLKGGAMKELPLLPEEGKGWCITPGGDRGGLPLPREGLGVG